MRTQFSPEQLQELIARHYDCDINFLSWEVDADGVFQGVTVDSRLSIDVSALDREPVRDGAEDERRRLEDALEAMRSRKRAAYEERNRVVAAFAWMAVQAGWKAGISKTSIEGWSDDWHGCVYIDLPTGQVSWHFHDSHAPIFAGLPAYDGRWDGHETPEKYARVSRLGPHIASRATERTLSADDAWLVYYEDASQMPEIFAGAGAKEAARNRFEQASSHWTAHLFQRVASNCDAAPTTDSLSAVKDAQARLSAWCALGPFDSLTWVGKNYSLAQAKSDVMVLDKARPIDPGCICRGNWRSIVKEYERLIGRQYRREVDSTLWTFFGLVHADDDYYYGMCNKSGVTLVSCVGHLEGAGFELIEPTRAHPAAHNEKEAHRGEC